MKVLRRSFISFRLGLAYHTNLLFLTTWGYKKDGEKINTIRHYTNSVDCISCVHEMTLN